jgi:CBS domain-containing protein
MTIKRICNREVDTAGTEETARAAADRMAVRNVGSLVIIDEDRHPIGILTDRDLAVHVVGEGRDPIATLVGEVMTEEPRTIRESVPIEDALAMMRSLEVRRLPVVDSRRKLVGIVSVDDILSLLAEEFREIGRLLKAESPSRLAST